MTKKLLPVDSTRESAYEERIGHLRTGLERLSEEYNRLRQRMGMPPSSIPRLLLDQDVKRSIEQDNL